MQKRKGFTLVELVIVIAVIAILAGVLIGTFASVINKANESAKMQELKAAEHEQKANDLLKKIEDSNWYGWEDFEKSIVEKITAAIDKADVGSTVDVKLDSEVVSRAVNEAMTKYYAEHAMGNTSLTEDQVKAIIENALGSFKFSGVTSEQVKTIVETAVSKMSTGLTAAQVQKIVNAAADRVEAGQLTSGQITTIVSNAIASSKATLLSETATSAQVEAAVDAVVLAIKNKECKTLTAKEVEEIVNAAVKSAGSTTWVTPDTYATQPTFEVKTAEEVKGLATLVNAGYDFAGKTVTLAPETETGEPTTVLELDTKDWTPIGNSYDTQFKGRLQGSDNPTAPLVVKGLTLTEQFNAVLNGVLINCDTTGNMDKVGVGFVAYLGEGAVLENIVFEDVNINITDDRMDGISIGVAVGYLDGGTIKNVTVKSGTIKAPYRVGGLCGAAGCGTIENCEVSAGVTIASVGGKLQGSTNVTTGTHFDAAGLIGYARQFTVGHNKVVNIVNTKVLTTNISSVKAPNAIWTIADTAYDCTLTIDSDSTANKNLTES